jgi:aspartyl/asparaginyl beta-hydroxylase (cupin superfamily)
MELLFNLYEETLIKKNSLTLNLKTIYDNWKIKRALLNILWGLMNITALIYVTNIMIAIHFELLWLAFVILYASIYWIVSSLLIDILIGDEIDHKMSKFI